MMRVVVVAFAVGLVFVGSLGSEPVEKNEFGKETLELIDGFKINVATFKLLGASGAAYSKDMTTYCVLSLGSQKECHAVYVMEAMLVCHGTRGGRDLAVLILCEYLDQLIVMAKMSSEQAAAAIPLLNDAVCRRSVDAYLETLEQWAAYLAVTVERYRHPVVKKGMMPERLLHPAGGTFAGYAIE